MWFYRVMESCRTVTWLRSPGGAGGAAAGRKRRSRRSRWTFWRRGSRALRSEQQGEGALAQGKRSFHFGRSHWLLPGTLTTESLLACFPTAFLSSCLSGFSSPLPFPPRKVVSFVHLVQFQISALICWLIKLFCFSHRRIFSFSLATPLPFLFLPHFPFPPKPVVRGEGFLQEKRSSWGRNTLSTIGPGVGRGRPGFGGAASCVPGRVLGGGPWPWKDNRKERTMQNGAHPLPTVPHHFSRKTQFRGFNHLHVVLYHNLR